MDVALEIGDATDSAQTAEERRLQYQRRYGAATSLFKEVLSYLVKAEHLSPGGNLRMSALPSVLTGFTLYVSELVDGLEPDAHCLMAPALHELQTYVARLTGEGGPPTQENRDEIARLCDAYMQVSFTAGLLAETLRFAERYTEQRASIDRAVQRQ